MLSARAAVHEWYDDAAAECRIDVAVRDPVVGLVFEYAGRFEAEWVESESPPDDVRPASATAGE